MSRELIIDQFNKLIGTCHTEKAAKFKIINYRKVISCLKATDQTINTTEEVLALLRESGMKLTNEKPPNYKSKILLKIQEILTNGGLKELQEADADPKQKSIAELMTLPEIGPSTAERLYCEENITSIADLKQHLEDNPGLLNRKQLIGLRHYQDLQIRIPREEMDKWNQLLITITNMVVNKMKPKLSITNMELSGSYRRCHETSGDVDFYIAVDQPRPELMNEIVALLVKLRIINSNDIISQGKKKTMAVARLRPDGLARHLDIFIFSKQQYPFALMFATGSGEFNIKLRKHALKQGWSLSEKALRKGGTKGDLPDQETLLAKIGKTAIETERDIFTFLGVDYIEPNARTPNVSF